MINKITIRILNFEIMKISERWASQNNCSSFWRLYLNEKPTASVLCGKTEYKISPGCFHLIPAWTRFSCHNTGTTGHFYVHFNLMGIPGILIRKYWPAPIKLHTKAYYSKIIQNFKMDTCGSILSSQARINAVVYTTIAELFESLSKHNMFELEHLLQGNSRFTDMIEYIESCLHLPLTNSHLAKKCHMSEAHFVRSFAKNIGQSPAQYVQERRIAKASELLSFTDTPIDVISQECGFANRFHFSRIFKALIGQPPATYRRQKN